MKNNTRHYELDNLKKVTIVEIEDLSGSVVISSVYCPPKHIIVSEQFDAFFENFFEN